MASAVENGIKSVIPRYPTTFAILVRLRYVSPTEGETEVLGRHDESSELQCFYYFWEI